MVYVIFLEARCCCEYNKGLVSFEVDVKDHKWKEVKSHRNNTVAWCFFTMVVAKTICDLFKIVGIGGVRFGPREKEVSLHTHVFLF